MKFTRFEDITERYEIVLADPPWSYDDDKCNGGVSFEYPTMSLEEIKSLPVKDITAENCVLFLWATYPLLKEALEVIESWGFTYKSIAFQWVKTTSGGGYFFGLGRWTRSNTEPCLLAVKGKPQRISESVSQLICDRIRGHSQKPLKTYLKIEELIGKKKRIELFGREGFREWDIFGNQLGDIQNTL